MRLRNIFSHRNRVLLRELVVTDFKLRYQGSALGYLWSLFRPLFLFGILLVVFGLILKIGSTVSHYPIYLLLGLVLWSFFLEATNNGLQSIVGRSDLIRKVSLPKYIIVVSGTISALINLGLSMIVVFIFLAFNGIGLRLNILILPVLILELYVFALSLGFFLSAFYVKYRDISYIWELLLQAAFYATPIIYSLSLVLAKSPTIAKLMLMNPVAQIIQDARYALVTPETITLSKITEHKWLIAVPLLIVLATAAIASRYFRRNAKSFAENV